MVWPTLGSRKAKEQNRTHSLTHSLTLSLGSIDMARSNTVQARPPTTTAVECAATDRHQNDANNNGRKYPSVFNNNQQSIVGFVFISCQPITDCAVHNWHVFM